MRTSIVRPAVLRLLADRGPLSTPELLGADPALREGTLHHELPQWLAAGLVERERDPWTGPGAAPYRYAITELGRGVLQADET